MTDGPLHLTGTVARGSFTAELDLLVGPGEVVALLGPNGAGKSTALRTVAGLEPLRSGRLTLGAQVLDEPASRTLVAAAHRRVGTVFQDHRLFPHLSARANVAFGPRARGRGRAEAEHAADEWLDRLGVAALARRRPAQLSGGQAQRVAVARALAADPLALVLDEPLAALDAQSRGEVQRALSEHLIAFAGPCLLVTHDLVDALVLADRIVVVEEGRVVQSGTPAQVLRRPATQYVAHLLGVNLFQGAVAGLPAHLAVAVRPSSIRLTPATEPEPAVPGSWSGTVTAVVPWGDHVRVEVAGEPSAVVEVPTSGFGPGLMPGRLVRLTFEPRAAEAFDGAGR